MCVTNNNIILILTCINTETQHHEIILTVCISRWYNRWHILLFWYNWYNCVLEIVLNSILSENWTMSPSFILTNSNIIPAKLFIINKIYSQFMWFFVNNSLSLSNTIAFNPYSSCQCTHCFYGSKYSFCLSDL